MGFHLPMPWKKNSQPPVIVQAAPTAISEPSWFEQLQKLYDSSDRRMTSVQAYQQMVPYSQRGPAAWRQFHTDWELAKKGAHSHDLIFWE